VPGNTRLGDLHPPPNEEQQPGTRQQTGEKQK
jgi:hypothetical protein